MTIFKIFLTDFLSLIYPSTCSSCNNLVEKDSDILCDECLKNLPTTESHKRELPYLKDKFYGRIQPFYILAFLHYSRKGIVKELFYSFKYEGKKEVAAYLGYLFGKSLQEDELFQNSTSVLVPVPLHPEKQKQRGYNQSEEICNGLAKALKIPINTSSLQRTKVGDSQTRKTRTARWENLQETFAVVDPVPLTNRHVILVDDVLTTGATIEVCYSEIMKANPTSVSILTLAVVPPR